MTGKELEDLMYEKRVTPAELAIELNVTRQAVYKWMKLDEVAKVNAIAAKQILEKK